MKKIAVASDHAGYDLKEYLKKNITTVQWVDEGPSNTDRTDYPDFAEKVAKKVADQTVPFGVLVCGSGIGMCIAANKVNGVRAAVVESEQTARLSRAHNNANVLCLGARILTPEYAKGIVTAWLDTPFEGGRHEGRVQKIANLESTGNAHPSASRSSSKK
jgi:ribose 5-phosphate isomerase B